MADFMILLRDQLFVSEIKEHELFFQFYMALPVRVSRLGRLPCIFVLVIHYLLGYHSILFRCLLAV